MTHSDPELLAMMAMGETDVPADVVAHVESCELCRSELRSLRRVADLARSGAPDDGLVTPHPGVWASIAEQTGVSPAVAPAFAAPRSRTGSRATGRDTSRHAGGIRSGRRSRRPVLIAVSGLLVAASAVAIVVAGFQRETILTQVPLDALTAGADGGDGVTGSAVVERNGDGERDVVVTVDGAGSGSATSAFREVWLISPDLERLVSLGTLDGDEGRFVLPAGLDLAEYPIVDVSVEPLDGDPGHSGRSIARGTLPGV